MNNFTIVEAKENEIPVIMDLIKALAIYEKEEDAVVATPELLKEWLFKKQVAEVLIAKENEVPVGFMLFFHNFSTWVGRGGIYLEDFFVKPEYRKKGYGKALFKRLAQIAMERKCGRLEWACLDWNTPSIEFYKSLGAIPMNGWTTYRLTTTEIENIAEKN
ncbi:MAG: GNAT family N-acetyltransferase [Coprobacillaceae bacterium]